MPINKVQGEDDKNERCNLFNTVGKWINSRERIEVELFAGKHELRVIGESHYPFSVPILNPDDFVNVLLNMNAGTFIFDDECLIFADI